MLSRTIYLSRLIGLFMLILSIEDMMHKTATVEIVTTVVNNPSLMFTYGILTLLAGLATVLAHNVWTGGAASVVVTLIGWALLIKGAVVIFIAQSGITGLLETTRYAEYYDVYAAIPLLLGLYLTYVGFSAHHSKRHKTS